MIERRPFVSVVTPVHDGAEFLAECIESVQRQTYSDWEYVIVDNCSTDASPTIAGGYALQDHRIRMVRTPSFLDAIDSQNFALRQISPESVYCKVVHADDWIFPECLQRMVELAEAHPTVGLVSAYRLEGNEVGLDGLPYPSETIPGRDLARRSLLGGPYVFGSPTSLLLRSDIVRLRPQFYTVRHPWTDTDVCYDILRHWDFGFVHQVLTFTRRHEGAGSAFAARVNTYALGNFVLLQKYGPEFLTNDEFQQRVHEVLAEYRRLFVLSVTSRHGRAFRAYHARGLELAGHPLRVRDLLLTTATLVVTRLWRPIKVICGSLFGLIRESLPRRSPDTPHS